MTDTELNRKVCKKLGIEWHEVVQRGFQNLCSCGFNCYLMVTLDKHIKDSNPDFTLNAKDLIEVLMKHTGWRKFRCEILEGNHLRIIDRTDSIYKYILNPRLLCERFLEWEG